MSELHTAGVDHAGLMQVLAHNLYSTPEVALRELVQNAHDSCTRRKLECPDQPFEPRIDVIADDTAHTLTIRDNGAGLTAEEISRYLATIGGGYTRVLRESHASDDLIGAFGLGFLSAYVVAEQVEVVTTSVHTGQGHRFLSRDGLRYTIDPVATQGVGTAVTLYLKPTHQSLGHPDHVRHLLARFARLLEVPIFCPLQVNAERPSWRHGAKTTPAETAEWFERSEVLAAFPLLPGDLEAGGVLWIHDRASWATTDHRGVTVYVRGMLVNEKAVELLPNWAGFVGAAVECDHLIPTASREDLQRDRTWHAMADALRESLLFGLKQLAEQQPHRWRRIVTRHNQELLGAALSDSTLLSLLQDILEVPTSEGPLTLPQIAARSRGQVLISYGDDTGETLLQRAQGVPVVDGIRFGAGSFAKAWAERHGSPVVVLGTADGTRQTFRKVDLPKDQHARLSQLFQQNDVAIQPARFQPASVPLVLVPDRDAQLKRRVEEDQFHKSIGSGLLALTKGITDRIDDTALATLFVNVDNPLVQRLAHTDHPHNASLARILLTLSEVGVRSGSELGVELDLAQSLAAFNEAVESLLE